jgi:hypothetical protein
MTSTQSLVRFAHNQIGHVLATLLTCSSMGGQELSRHQVAALRGSKLEGAV